VTGFDNTHLAEYITPSITTVDIHRDWLGRMAADALHELSNADEPQGKEYTIPAELVIKASTGPARSQASRETHLVPVAAELGLSART